MHPYNTRNQSKVWIASSALSLMIGLAVGSAGVHSQTAVQAPAPNPQERGIDANLYMQTSAEYAAVCLQTYNWGLERLKLKLAAAKHGDLRPAVVMDLDETVLDNSGYQSFLYREKKEFNQQTWDLWERNYPQEVRLIPGAKPFVDAAEQMGTTVVYISNRNVKNQDSTIAALKAVGIGVEGIADRLMLSEGPSDKTERRKKAESRFNVLLYFGDNLRDFSEEFLAPKLDAGADDQRKKAVDERLAKTQKANYHWGNDWIVLPNPAYGEWLKLVGNPPGNTFRPTAMKAP